MANIGNSSTNASDGKYAAKRNDSGKGKTNRKENQNTPNQTNNQNIPNSSNGKNKQNNNEKDNKNKKQNPKEDAKQKAKEQAATTAMSALGVPAPLAKALSKPVVNKLDKQQNKPGNGLLTEQQKIKQGQERLNNIRNVAGAMNESKKQKETEENGEEEQSPSLMDQVEDIKAKAENISGIVKFIKMIPAPVWGGILGTLLALFFIFLIFLVYESITNGSLFIHDNESYILENVSINNNNNTNSTIDPNNAKLQYPTITKQISAGYPNYSDGSYHGGIDFPVATGSDVYAAAEGTVQVSQALKNSRGNYRSFGEYIVIDHGNGLTTLYGHNSQRLVQEGDKVTKGQVIAKSGSTGNSSGPHVHFEVRINNKQVDPMKYLSDE